jgi:prephenate dehydrogenase
MPRVTIFGTGLIGASLGLRLRRSAHGAGLEVVGSDSFLDHARAAERAGAIDRSEPNPRRAVEGAGLVVLATPILAMRDLLEEIAPALAEGAIVTDVGSTKAEVLRWAQQLLPPTVSFVGGHPMAGKTQSGPAAADPALFEGARWVVVPTRTAAGDAVDVVRGLALTAGARPLFMDAAEHDAYVAAISHLPQLAATALFRLTRDSQAWPELSVLAASGFRDTTRLAGTDATMAHDIAITNRAQIAHWLGRYREQLRLIQEQLEDTADEGALFRLLSESAFEYDAFLGGAIGRREVDEQLHDELPEVSMLDMLVSPMMMDRARELLRRQEDRLQESERRARGERG